MLRIRPALRGPAFVLALAVAAVSALVIPVIPQTASGTVRLAVAAFTDIPHPAPRPVQVVSRSSARRPGPDPVFVAPDGSRITVDRIHSYLLRHSSPFAPYAALVVREGVTWRVDPRVVVAIAGVESSFGVVRRGFNAWGWNVRTIRYSSWENAIHRFTKAFSFHYGCMRYGDFVCAAARYDPPSPSTWMASARAYFNAI